MLCRVYFIVAVTAVVSTSSFAQEMGQLFVPVGTLNPPNFNILCEIKTISPLMVPIGKSGNPPSSNGFGRVNYEYEISKYEVQNSEYAAFLNATTADGDPYGYYNPEMQSLSDGGIIRTTYQGKNCYYSKKYFGNKPVNHVTWLSAIAFVNWLENGQSPSLASTRTGTYDLSNGSEAFATAIRSSKATWFMPNRNEWEKAAYFDPALYTYWRYATASNTLPSASTATPTGNLLSTAPNTVNYQNLAQWNGSQRGNVTSVGSAGPNSLSAFGVADMNGNVGEWLDRLSCSGNPPLCGRDLIGMGYSTPAYINTGSDGQPNIDGLRTIITALYGYDSEGNPYNGENHQGGTAGFRIVRITPQ